MAPSYGDNVHTIAQVPEPQTQTIEQHAEKLAYTPQNKLGSTKTKVK